MSVKRSASENIFEKKAKKGDWISDLDEKGYAVVPGVLTDAECDSVLEKMKSFIAGLGRNIEERNDLSNIHGIYQHYGVGQSAAVWEVRTNPAVARPFEEIYGTNDLLVSFDGFCLMLPTRRFQKGKYWLHMDQSAKATGRQCIQGYVNLFDSSTDRTGSLLVLPGSHLKFADFFSQFPEMREKAKTDWCKLETDEQREFFGVEPTRVHGPRGSMVLWDSRTVHQNIGPAVGASEALPRCVVYTCFQPRSWCSEKNLSKKKDAFSEFRMTTHWPASKIKLFGKNPRTYGVEPAVPIPEYHDRVDSQRVLELAGVVPKSGAVIKKQPLLEFAN